MTRAVPHRLLVGLGHAHLFVLEALARAGQNRLRTTLVTPGAYHYSWIVPGTIARDYRPAQSLFRPGYLARAVGATWIDAQVLRIDPHQQRVQLADGRSLSYDLVLFNIGSGLAADHLPGVQQRAIRVKPVSAALGVQAAAATAVEQAPRTTPAEIIIVGGGAAGTEMAFCLDAALAQRYARGWYRVTILEAGRRHLGSYPERFHDKVLAVLHQRGIAVRTNVTVVAVEPARIAVQHGSSIRYDALLWATGPRAPRLFRDSDLSVDQAGYLRVTSTLQVEGHPMIFGAGFVYAEGSASTLTVGDQTTTIELGKGAAVPSVPHTHGPGTFMEIRLAAPGTAPQTGATRVFASPALEGIPAGTVNLQFVDVVLPPNGGQTSIHTHPGPETIYVRAGPFEYQNALHGTETVQVGDVRSLPPGTPVQKRNPGNQEAAFLTLFVVDPNQPLAPEASFGTTPTAQPTPPQPVPPAQASQAAPQQPTAPAALPNTGGDQPLLSVLLVLSLVALFGGSAVHWSTRHRSA